MIGYEKPKSYRLTPSRNRFGKSLAHGSKCALIRECFKDDTVHKYIIRKVGSMEHNEIVTLCSDKIISTLLNAHPDMLSCFSWEVLYLEISDHCPILTQVMKCETSTRQPRTNQKAIICLCIAIMHNNRRTSMSLVQQTISILLYTGHTSKEVSLSIGHHQH